MTETLGYLNVRSFIVEMSDQRNRMLVLLSIRSFCYKQMKSCNNWTFIIVLICLCSGCNILIRRLNQIIFNKSWIHDSRYLKFISSALCTWWFALNGLVRICCLLSGNQCFVCGRFWREIKVLFGIISRPIMNYLDAAFLAIIGLHKKCGSFLIKNESLLSKLDSCNAFNLDVFYKMEILLSSRSQCCSPYCNFQSDEAIFRNYVVLNIKKKTWKL